MKVVDKAQQLRQHKQLATGLFLLMLALFIMATLLLRTHQSIALGYLKAFAEAAMVGALADWFAVTALFHYPLGLRIPHTNLIENSKKTIGDNLGNFVESNFLTPANIRPYIQKLATSTFAGQWLVKEKNKKLLLTEIARLLNDLVQRADDAVITDFITKQGIKLLNTLPLHTMAASALQYFLDHNEQEKGVTLLAAKVRQFITENETLVQERVKKESPFFIPGFVDKKLAQKISSGLIGYFEEIENDPQHRVRQEVNDQLQQFATSLHTDAKWSEQLNELKTSLLTPEKLQQYATDIWQGAKKTLQEELVNESSAVLSYISTSIDELAYNLNNDAALQQKIDSWIRFTAYKYILRNTSQAGILISSTVGNWQGRELSQKLELEVGKDLQFIRINGTLVGGLIGLLIYTVERLLG